MDFAIALVFVVPAVTGFLVISIYRILVLRSTSRDRVLGAGDERLVFVAGELETLRAAGAELGLSVRSTGFVVQLEGRIEPFEILARYSAHGDGTRIARYVLSVEARAPRRLPADVTIGGETTEAPVPSGDRRFDERVEVYGPKTSVRALLDHRAREALRALGPAIALRKGTLVLRHVDAPDPTRATATAAGIAGVVRRAVEVASLLRADEKPVQRLAVIAAADPLAAVRLGALRELVQVFAAAPETQAALQAALEDREPRIRLYAALLQREDAIAEAAIRNAPELEVPELCALVLGLRAVAALPALLGVLLNQRRSEPARCAAAEVLAELAGSEVMSDLLDALARRHLHPPAVAAAIEVAVRRIGSRAGDGARGQLSLGPATDAGAVSLTEEPGALSLTKPR